MERSVNAIKIHPQIFLLHTTTWYCTYYFTMTDLIKPSSFQVRGRSVSSIRARAQADSFQRGSYASIAPMSPTDGVRGTWTRS